MVLCSLLIMPALATAQLPQGQGAPATAAGQNQNGAQQAGPIRTVTNGVIVPVTVKNKEGQLVGDLQKDDFRVLVDGMEQKILTFTAEPVALAAVILIDNDLTKKQADEVQKSLAAISGGFGPNDEAALVTFSEYPTVVQEFTKDNDDLFTKLKRLEIGSHSSSVATGPTSSSVPVINGNTNPATAPPTGLGIPLHGSGRYQTDTALDDALYSAAGMFEDRAERPEENCLPDFRWQQFAAKPAYVQRDRARAAAQGRFRIFDYREPFGSGSGGQVHRGARRSSIAEICSGYRRRYFLWRKSN